MEQSPRCFENLICQGRGDTKYRLGIFHIKCLDDILDLSSPAILPHVIYSRTGALNYRLDKGAIAIVQAWYGKCQMENETITAISVTTNTVSKVVASTDEGISSTEPGTATSSPAPSPADEGVSSTEPGTATPSSASAPAASTRSQFQWQAKNLVYLPDLNEPESTKVRSYSWHHDREALFVPWSEDIVTDKLPRLPSNGGFILEDDALMYLDEKPLWTADQKLWSILSYLPHEPSQWREKNTLSESLGRWYEDRVRSQPLKFRDIVHADHRTIQKQYSGALEGPEWEEEQERTTRLGVPVIERIKQLARKVA